MAKLKRSNEHKAFSDVKLLFAERCEALKGFCVQNHPCFLGDTAKDVEKRLNDHLQEAEYDASLTLLAAIEAAFRLDYDYRQTKRLKDPRSKEIRRISQLHKTERSHFRHDIAINKLFEVLAMDDSISTRVIKFMTICFDYRNWLAHGRYWRLSLGRDKPAFAEIYQIAQTIEKTLYRYR